MTFAPLAQVAPTVGECACSSRGACRGPQCGAVAHAPAAAAGTRASTLSNPPIHFNLRPRPRPRPRPRASLSCAPSALSPRPAERRGRVPPRSQARPAPTHLSHCLSRPPLSPLHPVAFFGLAGVAYATVPRILNSRHADDMPTLAKDWKRAEAKRFLSYERDAGVPVVVNPIRKGM